MIVIANGTRYGSGAVINPLGRLDDNLFEVVIIRKISFSEIFKMMFTHRPYDKTKQNCSRDNHYRYNQRKKHISRLMVNTWAKHPIYRQ